MNNRRIQVLLVTAALLFAAVSIAYAQDQGNSNPYYTLLTQGMLASPAFPFTFTDGNFRVEARNLVIGHAKASGVPIPTDMLMELRGGAVTTTINGQTQQRRDGDFWIVEKNSHVDIENTGQVAVIRAIYVYAVAK